MNIELHKLRPNYLVVILIRESYRGPYPWLWKKRFSFPGGCHTHRTMYDMLLHRVLELVLCSTMQFLYSTMQLVAGVASCTRQCFIDYQRKGLPAEDIINGCFRTSTSILVVSIIIGRCLQPALMLRHQYQLKTPTRTNYINNG